MPTELLHWATLEATAFDTKQGVLVCFDNQEGKLSILEGSYIQRSHTEIDKM